jgi:hypothetical protein
MADVETGAVAEQKQQDNTKETKESIDCPICFEDNKDMVALACSKHHMFCRDCIDHHFKDLYMSNQSLVCPLCRCELLPNTDIDYISVRKSLLQVLQQRMMTQTLQIEHDAQNTQNARILPIVRYQHISVRDNFKWERLIVGCMLLALTIALIVIFAVVVHKV